MTAQDIRFVYTDSVGTDQVIASTVGQGAEIDHASQDRNYRDTDVVKVWGGSELFNAFPQNINEFESNEPEIYMQENVNGTWTNVQRCYAKGSGDVKDKDSTVVKLFSFHRYNEKQDVSISNTTTHIVDVAEKLAAELTGNYVIDAPAEVDVSGGYPTVGSYSYNGKAENVIQELTRDYKWSLRFTDETDGSGNTEIRFEPQGFGGAIDTLDSNTVGLEIENWEKERTDSIINKVTVQGVNSNGNKVTGTAVNQNMINKYGVKFSKISLGFLEDSTEANNIAEQRLNPGKDSNGNDITSAPEGGIVSLPTGPFREGVENSSINLIDSDLNIDDTFTIVKQKLFYPSGRTQLHLDFEQENMEGRAEKDKFLGDERAALFPNQTEDVGNQPIQTTDGSGNPQSYTNTASADLSKTGGVDNGNTGVATAQDPATVPISASAFSTVTFSVDVPDDPIASTVIGADVMYSYTNQSGGDMGIRYSIEVNGTEVESGEANSPSDELYVADSDGIVQNFDIGNLSVGDTITIQLTSLDPSTFTASSLFETASGKTFLTDFATAVTTYSEYQIGDDIQFGDNGHGSTTDVSTHTLEGNTEPDQNLDVATEDKTDR